MPKNKKDKSGLAKMQAKRRITKKSGGLSKKAQKALSRARSVLSKATSEKKAEYLKAALLIIDCSDIGRLAKQIRREGSQASPEERQRSTENFIRRVKR